jgi:aldehyde:ferredoxin oxidoreductase
MSFAVRTAIIDLSRGEIKITRTPDTLVRGYLGGRGLNIAYLRHYLRRAGDPRQVDPLGPDNPLIFGAGLLTGTIAPNAARFNVSARSPESGILGDANCGGFFAAAMRKAGFDRLVILGRAERPSYLLLEITQSASSQPMAYGAHRSLRRRRTLKRGMGRGPSRR